MEIFLNVLLVIFLVAALAVIPFGLPGTFLIVLSALLYALATEFAEITWATLALLFAFALFAEGVETAAGIMGAKRYGSGNAGIFASLAGGITGALLGAPFFFGLGAIPGALIGAFAAAVLAEVVRGRSLSEALRAGWGTFLGRVAGTAVKGAVAVSMAVICLRQILL
jgi:uncharacterized protein YqgC (DUF456 family)